jgi:universal stress protein E
MAAIDPGHRLNKQGELDKRILTLAHGIAQQLNLPLHACHCFDPSYWEILFKAVGVAEIWTDVFPANPDVNDHRVLDDLRELHSKKFNQDCQDTVPNSENRHLIEGSVDEVIPTLVLEQKVAIVVLSTEHRTGLLESTAEDILEAVECDVLAIKPAGFESPFTDRLR